MRYPATPRWESFGGAGPGIVFAHANGLPPGCYRRLLTDLARDHQVTAALHRPLWDPAPAPRAAGWGLFGDDLLATLNQRGLREPVIGVGHSLGAISLVLAAAQAPERFRALVLIDPVLVRPAHVFLYSHGTWLLPPKRALLRATRRRRDHWPDRAAAFANLRSKALFGAVDDAGLADCVDAMVSDDPAGGVRLRFPKAWEAAIFARAPWAWGALRRVDAIPTLAVRATRSNLLTAVVWKHWQRVMPRARFVEVAGSHLVPIEAPFEVAAQVRAFLHERQQG